ncbi:Phage antirepressor protein KilAC domain protein [Photobacterium piscicola]|uniref:Phage antirepressor protein KilAC domain protein n=1 Tax=Photobacterium piscicola TaxID=1378299 RepID=A0A1T5HXY7_9GAMM|nr:glycerol kinase [Photobacterium piscicola]SKC31670.1 Phage antirepressor protein KilAC domain protein [Photobacterium piscicola]
MTSKISTSQLAKAKGLVAKNLFSELAEAGYIIRDNKEWLLTDIGKAAQGEYKQSSQFGQYIVWPEALEIITTPLFDGKKLSATQISTHFKLSSQKINQILDELGWINKAVKGWKVSQSGSRLGGVQKEDSRTGIPYVIWDETVLKNSSLLHSVNEITGINAEVKSTDNSVSNFRQKFEAKHRAADGHYVRSKAEMLIDNWLYMAGIVHAYERKLPIEEDLYCDFYLPTGKVYIEFWGLEDDPKYASRKKIKQDLYTKYGFNLIELNDNDVQNLDDVLPRMLLKFDIKAY